MHFAIGALAVAGGVAVYFRSCVVFMLTSTFHCGMLGQAG
jgi:hypothetical protein